MNFLETNTFNLNLFNKFIWGDFSNSAENASEYFLGYFVFLTTKLNKGLSINNHPFHLVEPSPLPLLTSLFLAANICYFVVTSHVHSAYVSEISLFLFLILFVVLHAWILSVNEEESQGCHTMSVQSGFKLGILLFILSEVMLFSSFFWAFFHVSLNPSVLVGMRWPMEGILCFSWSNIPLINTLLLLSSGISITLAHSLGSYWDSYRASQFWLMASELVRIQLVSVISRNNSGNSVLVLNSFSTLVDSNNHWIKDGNNPENFLVDTIASGVIFLLCQFIEYYFSPFSISDGVYGSVFFMATGLHGLHVLVGLSALYYCLLVRLFSNNTGMVYWSHRVGFTGSVWYWHFVDVVWLFLFIVIYWWSGY